jgi:hypothetical protein
MLITIDVERSKADGKHPPRDIAHRMCQKSKPRPSLPSLRSLNVNNAFTSNIQEKKGKRL